MNLNRDKLGWGEPIWHAIDQAVHEQELRSEVASKFIPLRGPFPDALNVPSQIVDPESMTVNEGLTTALTELWVEFGLTEQQVENEDKFSTAVTLATRAASLVSRAEDLLVFQGAHALKHPVFQRIRLRAGLPGDGLVQAAGKNPIVVPPMPLQVKNYSDRTFEALVQALACLEQAGHYGPYALVLHSALFADAYAPLGSTLAVPADRIKTLVTSGFYGSSALPAATGLVVSLGGDTIDLVVGVIPTVAFLNTDSDGLYRFRLFERIALRIKDPTCIIRLEFRSDAA